MTNKKWREIVTFYNLRNYEIKAKKLYDKTDPWLDEDFVDKDEYHLYICSDCMEKALGRKILPSDLLTAQGKIDGLWYYNKEFEKTYFKQL